jgi:hypothetical protein
VSVSIDASADTLELPKPEAPPPRVIREETPGPIYYRYPPDAFGGLGRSSLGLGVRGARDDHDGGTLDGLDATVARRFGAAMRSIPELTARPATAR